MGLQNRLAVAGLPWWVCGGRLAVVGLRWWVCGGRLAVAGLRWCFSKHSQSSYIYRKQKDPRHLQRSSHCLYSATFASNAGYFTLNILGSEHPQRDQIRAE